MTEYLNVWEQPWSHTFFDNGEVRVRLEMGRDLRYGDFWYHLVVAHTFCGLDGAERWLVEGEQAPAIGEVVIATNQLPEEIGRRELIIPPLIGEPLVTYLVSR